MLQHSLDGGKNWIGTEEMFATLRKNVLERVIKESIEKLPAYQWGYLGDDSIKIIAEAIIKAGV